MKSKILNTVLIFTFSCISLIARDCMLDFSDSFSSATLEYERDLVHCESQWIGSDLCSSEADRYYDREVNKAGNAFLSCVRG